MNEQVNLLAQFQIPQERKDEIISIVLTTLLITLFGRHESREKWFEEKTNSFQFIGDERRFFWWQVGFATCKTDIINFLRVSVIGVFGVDNNIAVFTDRNFDRIQETVFKVIKIKQSGN